MVGVMVMEPKSALEVVSDFFLDGAKIIFGSLVVGVFVPGAAGKIPWLICAIGVAVTMLFLTVAAMLAKTASSKR